MTTNSSSVSPSVGKNTVNITTNNHSDFKKRFIFIILLCVCVGICTRMQVLRGQRCQVSLELEYQVSNRCHQAWWQAPSSAYMLIIWLVLYCGYQIWLVTLFSVTFQSILFLVLAIGKWDKISQSVDIKTDIVNTQQRVSWEGLAENLLKLVINLILLELKMTISPEA